MKHCLHKGTLRAYLDRELPPEEMERLAAHLGECGQCTARRAELAGRSARVAALMDALPEPDEAIALPLITRQPRPAWQWVAVAGALAAAVVVAYELAPRPVPVAPAILSPVSSVAEVRPPISNAKPAPPAQPAPPRRATRHAAKPQPAPDYFLALDDDPIETGVVMRVAVGPAEIPADVIFDQGGRARAIRLVR